MMPQKTISDKMKNKQSGKKEEKSKKESLTKKDNSSRIYIAKDLVSSKLFSKKEEPKKEKPTAYIVTQKKENKWSLDRDGSAKIYPSIKSEHFPEYITEWQHKKESHEESRISITYFPLKNHGTEILNVSSRDAVGSVFVDKITGLPTCICPVVSKEDPILSSKKIIGEICRNKKFEDDSVRDSYFLLEKALLMISNGEYNE